MRLFSKKQISLLEKEIINLHEHLNECEPGGEAYNAVLANLETLYNLKRKDYKVDPETIMVVGGNLAGIAMILGYERANVLTSKAVSFVMRGRV